jgi:hypothetical protein
LSGFRALAAHERGTDERAAREHASATASQRADDGAG